MDKLNEEDDLLTKTLLSTTWPLGPDGRTRNVEGVNAETNGPDPACAKKAASAIAVDFIVFMWWNGSRVYRSLTAKW